MIASYARQSNEDASQYSISRQLEANREKANKLFPGVPIREYIDDGYSGEFLDRPAMTRLRKDVKDGIITKVICFDPDRLSRKLINQLIITDEFEQRDVEIIFVNGEYAKTPEGQLFYSMRGAISEFEKAKINERMSGGRRQKARKGKVVSDYRVYGYNYDPETSSMVINEDEAAIVRLIFDLCTKPVVNWRGRQINVQGFNGIAKFLTEEGIPTKKGGKVWHRQVVRQILMNQTYIGEFYQNRWNCEGMLANKYRPPEERIPVRERPREEWIRVPCPAIIGKEQFEHAQKIIQESKRRWARKPKNRYLLSGILRCSDCGNTMVGIKKRNWGKDAFIYTCTKNTAGAKNKGCGKRIKCEKLDNEIWNTIHNWLNQPDEVAAARSEEVEETNTKSYEQAEKERLEKEIEKARNARKRLLKLFASEEVDEEEVKEELREWKEKEEKLLKQLEEINEQLNRIEENTNTQYILQEAINYYLSKNPDELTFDDKQTLIRMVVREARVSDEKVDLYLF